SRDLVDADRRHFEDLGDMIHCRSRQPSAVLFLRDPQQRQDRARLTARRGFPDMGLGALDIFPGGFKLFWRVGWETLCPRAHRSTSPNTMSIEPMIATTSASMWPRHMKSVACKKAKPGDLILQR